MDHFETQYEKLYQGEEYYWGKEPAPFLDGLIGLLPAGGKNARVLDIGCGEGKDAVYMASKGFDVCAFDITHSGIEKTKRLAAEKNVRLDAYISDINDLRADGPFDIIYSTGTVQYLREDRKKPFFDKVKSLTAQGGLCYFNVFVEKPFLPLPPDWDMEEKMWRTGELFSYFHDWEIVDMAEVTFEDNSAGVLHYHCMDTMTARKK